MLGSGPDPALRHRPSRTGNFDGGVSPDRRLAPGTRQPIVFIFVARMMRPTAQDGTILFYSPSSEGFAAALDGAVCPQEAPEALAYGGIDVLCVAAQRGSGIH